MKLVFICLMLSVSTLVSSQTIIPLYKGLIPNARTTSLPDKVVVADDGGPRVSKVSEPTLTVYLPAKEQAKGTAVIICPGGGYARLAIKKEGDDVAKLLSEWGIAAFVLKYRLPDDSLMTNKEVVPLQDAQRAMQLVRERAKDWNIDPKKVGIMGFSAGGHLASTLGTHFTKAVIENKKKINLRPDFMILMYPVISLSDSLAHLGSRINLLGKLPTASLVKEYSNEQQVTKNTPPSLLVHAKDDKTVKVENSMLFYKELQDKKVPSEIHLYEKGGHGFGLINATSSEKWTDWLKVWMQPFM